MENFAGEHFSPWASSNDRQLCDIDFRLNTRHMYICILTVRLSDPDLISRPLEGTGDKKSYYENLIM